MGRGLGVLLNNLSPSIHSLTVLVPSSITLITAEYRSKIPTIRNFRPNVIILHLGHNDLVYHPIHNLNPSISTAVASDTITLANEIHQNHPDASIFISAIFPRTSTDSSLLSYTDVISYNRMAKRHGQRIRTFAKIADYHYLINNYMWRKISGGIEESSYFLPDGLHLNPTGQLSVLLEWLETIARDDTVPTSTA